MLQKFPIDLLHIWVNISMLDAINLCVCFLVLYLRIGQKEPERESEIFASHVYEIKFLTFYELCGV